MRVHDLGEGKNPLHKINKFLDDKEKRAEYARELQQKRDAEDKEKVEEDLSALPPLADLIVMAVVGQTTVAALKAAWKTGKYALKLKRLADKAGVKLNQAVMGEDADQEPMSSENYVLASPAGSSYVWLWKNVDGKATPVNQHLTTSEGGKLMRDHGIKWIRYGAQKYFDDLKNVNETWQSNMDKASKKAHADAAEKRKKMGQVTSKTLADINDKLGNNKKKTDEVEQIDEIFGFGKKAQMRRGAVKIATDVMFDQVIKPVLAAEFKGAFEGIDIKDDKSKDYVVTGYGFIVDLDVTDKYLAQGKSSDAYYVTGDLARKLDQALNQKYREWKSANPDNIHGEMVTSPSVTTTFAANIKNKDGNYEQNIRIRFRVIDGGINKQFANEAVNRDEYAAKLAVKAQDKFMTAALTALDRLVKNDPRGQSVGGYAFDIARAFGGVNARELEKLYSQQVQEDSDPCWKGYRQLGMKKKGGKEVPNCIPEDVTEITLDEAEEIFGELAEDENLTEAEYQGRTVKLNKPMRGDVKKFKVYVKNEKGNVVKVNFGDPDMRIKKSNPARRKSFRARHNCDNPGPKTKARYWSCKKW